MSEISRRKLLQLGTGSLAISAISGNSSGIARADQAPSKFRFAHLTDIHVQPELGAERGFRKCVAAVNALDPRPDFVITGGDLIMDALVVPRERAELEFKIFEDVCRDFAMPVYHTVGNHDVIGWAKDSAVKPDHHDYGKKVFAERLGQGRTYRSFDFGGWHFILLDSIGQDAETREYEGLVDEAQLEWLKKDLAAVGTKQPIVVVTHIPLATAYLLLARGPDFSPGPKSMVRNAHELRKLFKPYRVQLVLQGHVHVRERIDYLNTSYIMSGAVSGGWWKGPTAGEHPEGFGIVDIAGDQFQWSYQAYGWEAVKG